MSDPKERDTDKRVNDTDKKEDAAAANDSSGAPDEFDVGEKVIVREDFHSKYFRGLFGTISGPSREGGTPLPLWPVKLKVPPHEIVIAGKYLRRPTGEELAAEAPLGQAAAANGASGGGESQETGKKSFLSRFIPWNR